MGFIDNVVPAFSDFPAIKIEDDQTIKCEANGDPCAFIFKTVSEQNLGETSFFKVYSGEVKVGMELVNENTSNTERFNQLFIINGKNRINTNVLTAGDIGATVKLKNTHTNDTLHVKGKKLKITAISYPEPTIRTAIVSLKKGEEEKLSAALHQIREEDPALKIEYSQELKQTIIYAQGELQLNLIKQRLTGTFGLEIDFLEPRIPYRETIQKEANAMYRHKKQTGGAGQFGEVHMRIEPYREDAPDPKDLNVRKKETTDLKWGGKLEFLNCIVGGAIDQKYMSAIMKGVMEKLQEGPMTGSCVRDVRVMIYDGKMHPVDSNDISFKIAGLMAFKEAFMHADPALLEPLYEVEVIAPDEIGGDVMSDLQTRRAIILGIDSEGANQKIKAKVPLNELHNYTSALRSLSRGRAKHKQKFIAYAPVPYDIQKRLLEQHKGELQEA
ncbi:elongation factor G, partial [Candidatus Amoebophilus asiaticus]|nr:elongation factor G [Candidatus Amoebophilus asiaticus]